MTTTPEQAFAAVQKHLADVRIHAEVELLLQDDEDYFAALKLKPPAFEWPAGGCFVFVSKATGAVWEVAPGEEATPGLDVFDKIDQMVEVQISPPD